MSTLSNLEIEHFTTNGALQDYIKGNSIVSTNTHLETPKSKMQWFIDSALRDLELMVSLADLFKNSIEYQIKDTKIDKGTVVMPTGSGKSGVLYADIVYRIRLFLSGMLRNGNGESRDKLVFMISAPILKLCLQLTKDFMDKPLHDIFTNVCKEEKIMFFINSSENGNNYDFLEKYGDINVNYIQDFERFKNNDKAKIAFVTSCHKSLHRFASIINDVKKYAIVVTYLDESHTLLSNDNHDSYVSNGKYLTNKKNIENYSTLEQLCESDFLYSFSATPSRCVSGTIMKHSKMYDKKHNCYKGKINSKKNGYIIHVTAKECIKKGVIVPPKFYYKLLPDNTPLDMQRVDVYTCIDFMDFVCRDNPKINHKILVKCNDRKHLKSLESELNSRHYKVFATCAADGATASNEFNEMEGMDEKEFIDSIDNYNGSCFVLHIKQLIQGIDIKSLSDCIYYGSSHLGLPQKQKIIQTIGRILRVYSTDKRSITDKVEQDLRNKPYGCVLFVMKETDNQNPTERYKTLRQTGIFVVNYYGVESGFNVFGDMYLDEKIPMSDWFTPKLNEDDTNENECNSYFGNIENIINGEIKQMGFALKEFMESVIRQCQEAKEYQSNLLRIMGKKEDETENELLREKLLDIYNEKIGYLIDRYEDCIIDEDVDIDSIIRDKNEYVKGLIDDFNQIVTFINGDKE